jgi:hypothetical protein
VVIHVLPPRAVQAALPNFSSLEVKLKRVFGVCSLVCAVSMGTIVVLQLTIDEKGRVELCAAFFMASALICMLVFAVVGVGRPQGQLLVPGGLHCACLCFMFVSRSGAALHSHTFCRVFACSYLL